VKEYLFDTSGLIKWTQDKIPTKTKRLLTRDDVLFTFSVASLWEIAINQKLRKSGFTVVMTLEWISSVSGKILPIRHEHAKALESLQYVPDHEDPFDRMIIAQAMSENLPVVSSDQRFASYVGLKIVWD
jgi:PIN domain nuclease of toxin-antitoxin system